MLVGTGGISPILWGIGVVGVVGHVCLKSQVPALGCLAGCWSFAIRLAHKPFSGSPMSPGCWRQEVPESWGEGPRLGYEAKGQGVQEGGHWQSKVQTYYIIGLVGLPRCWEC